MAEGITLVRGGGELLEHVRPLWQRLNRHHEERSRHFADVFAGNTFEKRRANILTHGTQGLHVIMAQMDSGAYAGYCVSTINDSRAGEVDSLYLLPDLRGQGIGELLVQESISWLKAQGVTRIFLEVSAGNEEAYGFYAKLGFFPAKIILEQKEVR